MRYLAVLLLLLAATAYAVDEAVFDPTNESASIDFRAKTTDATANAPVARLNIQTPGLYRVHCRFLGKGPTAGALMFMERRCLARRTAGAVNVVGVQTVGADLGSQGWSATLAETGEVVEARVTGTAATVVNWRIRCDVDSW